MSTSQPQPTNGSGDNLSITNAWERSLVPAGGGEAFLLINIAATSSAKSTRRAPVDIAFVLDRSGSMADGKLKLAKEAIDAAIAHLNDDDRAALVMYDNDVDTLQPLSSTTPRVKATMRLTLNGIDPGGSTNLSGGWLTGCGELSKDLPAPDRAGHTALRIRRSLLLTDGLANAGISHPNELAMHASELRRRGVTTTTLGVGEDFDEELLSSMAEAGGGNFQFIGHASQLRAFFEKELGELLTIASAGMTVSLTMPHGVRARLLSEYPSERTGKRIDIAVGEIPAGVTVPLMFALEIAPGAIGTAHKLSVEAAWTDPAADVRRSIAMFLPALMLDDQRNVENAPVDDTVREEVAKQRSAADMREAMRLDRAGRHAESRAQLRAAAGYLAAAPATAEVHELYGQVARLADYDASVAYSEATRKQTVHDAHYRARRSTRRDR